MGEFGVPGDTPDQAATCRRLLKGIVDHRIPLAALWVFDFPNQQDFNASTGNSRSWQLDLIAEANRQFKP